MRYLNSTLAVILALGSGIHALSSLPTENQAADKELSAQDLRPAIDISAGHQPDWFRYLSELGLAPAAKLDVSTIAADVDTREEQTGGFFIHHRWRNPRASALSSHTRRPSRYSSGVHPAATSSERPRRRPGRHVDVSGGKGGYNLGNGANGGEYQS